MTSRGGCAAVPRAALVGGVLAATVVWSAHAATGEQLDDLFTIPPGAIAFLVFDPGGLGVAESPDPQRRLVQGAIRAALSSGMIADRDAAKVLGGLLAASVVGSTPHRLCVMAFQATVSADPQRWRITDLSAVLELRTSRDHLALVTTLRSILVAGGAAEGGDDQTSHQRPIELPGGLSGMTFTRDGWPAWRQISWASTPDAFYIAIGEDALADYLRSAANDDADPHWSIHRHTVEQQHGGRGSLVLEMYLDIDRIRRGFSDSFANGRIGDLFDAWGLSNARSFMFHARRIPAEQVRMIGVRDSTYRGPPLIAADATWSSRSDPPRVIGHLPVAWSDWPAGDLRLEPPPGSYAIVADMDWAHAIDIVLASYRGSRTRAERVRFDERRSEWEHEHKRALSRIVRSLDRWLVLSDVPASSVPGMTTAFIELKPAVSRARFERDFADLLASLGDRVLFDEQRAVWSLRLLDPGADPAGVFRALAWGLAGSARHGVIVAGWTPSVVESNRERLKRE